MKLKRVIIEQMNAARLRKAVRTLEVSVRSHREKASLAEGLRGARKATASTLLEFLTKKDIKQVCEKCGINSKGRKHELIARLLENSGTSGGTDRSAASAQRGQAPAVVVVGQDGQSPNLAAADLQFGPSTDRVGFTPAGIAAFSDLRPAAVVRELIQNSLDAALLEAGEQCARVRFEQSTCALDDIPGIESYRHAFQLACEEQSPAGSARAVVERIERTLQQRSQELLCVTDNGVGLDGKRMSALLSDGISAKGGNASGTFGNGHSVVVPASNLRYVLYGGLTKSGERFGGGQAVLASHRVEEGLLGGRSGRGIYLTSFEPSARAIPFTLVQDDAIPTMIASAIRRIETEYGQGAAVLIPAFNNFEHERPLHETVLSAAAFNFFQAIHDGRLVVEVADNEGEHVLDGHTLEDVLLPHKDEMRLRRSGAFLSGRKANEAYEALVRGQLHEVETAQGNVAVRLHCKETGRRSVGLCRNGMWITDELPRFQNAFGNRQPFQAMILLSSDREDSFFDLIREAETPLHDKLALKQMEPGRRAALREALAELRDGIADLVPTSADDVYSPDDVFEYQFEDLEAQGRGGRRSSLWGTVASTRRHPINRKQGARKESGGVGLGGDGRGRERKRPKGRVVVEPTFRIASVPLGEGRRAVQVESVVDFDDAEIRMFVDENVDATCDRQTRAQATAVLLSDVIVDGRPLDESKLVSTEDGAVGAKIGRLSANAPVVVEAECKVPASAMRLLPGQEPALRVEVQSGPEGASQGSSGADG